MKEPGFVHDANIFARCQRGGIAEWSACEPTDHKVVGSTPAFAEIFPSFLSRGCHLSTPPNTADDRLLGGRVVSVATLPVMVSRLG